MNIGEEKEGKTPGESRRDCKIKTEGKTHNW
jgi:hypothetical protein